MSNAFANLPLLCSVLSLSCVLMLFLCIDLRQKYELNEIVLMAGWWTGGILLGEAF